MNNKISELHLKAIMEWNMEDILLLFPEGQVSQIPFGRYADWREHDEKYESAMKHLDMLGVPNALPHGGNLMRSLDLDCRIRWLSMNASSMMSIENYCADTKVVVEDGVIKVYPTEFYEAISK